MPRNSQDGSWWTKIDVKVSQEIPGFREEDKASVFLIIENFGNFLNDDWGVLKEVSFPQNQGVVDADLLDNGTPNDFSDDQYLFESFSAPRGASRASDASLWEIRIGVKYSF